MQQTTVDLISRLKAIADPNRMRLFALCSRGECSVSELTSILAMSQPRISQHLKALCDASLLQRFRDGHFVYYRVPVHGDAALQRRLIAALLPEDEPLFSRDFDELRALRGKALESLDTAGEDSSPDDGNRDLHQAIIELTVTHPLGDLLDIGSGQGRLLKLLATRAHRAVGVDIDADARRLARAELLLAGVPNCTLRQGDMYKLPFDDDSFDTVILDDVLQQAERPTVAVAEAVRVLRHNGRLLFLLQVDEENLSKATSDVAGWGRRSALRVSAPKLIPIEKPTWLLAVATPVESDSEAA